MKKKILFTIQVALLIAAFPLYFYAEVNHAPVKTSEKNKEEINKEAENRSKAFVILKMPAAPEYQVQYINE